MRKVENIQSVKRRSWETENTGREAKTVDSEACARKYRNMWESEYKKNMRSKGGNLGKNDPSRKMERHRQGKTTSRKYRTETLLVSSATLWTLTGSQHKSSIPANPNITHIISAHAP